MSILLASFAATVTDTDPVSMITWTDSSCIQLSRPQLCVPPPGLSRGAGPPPLDPLATLCLTQPRRLFAAFATRACCWLRLNLVSTRSPRKVLFWQAAPQLSQHVLVPGVVPPQVQDSTLPLLNYSQGRRANKQYKKTTLSSFLFKNLLFCFGLCII